MNLKEYDDKCVRITTSSGEVYEGVVSYCSKEYVMHEYGENREALQLIPILLYKDEILSITSLEEVNGGFGHYSEAYGLLELKCLEWGTDMIEEVFESEDDIQIGRMLKCMSDHFQSLANRAVSAKALWSFGNNISDEEYGPVYVEDMRDMLESLIKYNKNDEVIEQAKDFLERFTKVFPEE